MKNSDDMMYLDQTLAIYATGVECNKSNGRQILHSDSINLIAALLREINETILPRRLVFFSESDETLCFDVADRRILGCVDLTSGVETGIMEEPGNHLTKCHIDRIMILLSNFTARHEVLWVHSIMGRGLKLSGSDGVSATTMIEQLNSVAINQQKPPGMGIFAQYIHRLGPAAKNYMILKEGLKFQSLGDITNLVRIQNDFLHISTQAKGNNIQMVLLQESGTKSNRRDLLFAESGSHQLLMEFGSEDPIFLIETWLSVKTTNY